MPDAGVARAQLHEEKDPSSRLEFGLNPTQISYSRNVRFTQDPKQAGDHPKTQFAGVQATSLQLSLLLDAVGARDRETVQRQLHTLMGWTCPPDGATSAKASPPTLVFSWGAFAISAVPAFTGFLESVKVTVEMFARDGTPLRANVSLSLTSDVHTSTGTNPTSGAERSRRRRILERGQSLQRLAYEELGDAGAWPLVAELNGIDDPTRLRPGSEILLPDPAELRPARV